MSGSWPESECLHYESDSSVSKMKGVRMKAPISGCVIVARGDTWPICDPRYRGVCRGTWWPLGAYEQTDRRSRELTTILASDVLGRPPADPSPDVSRDLEYLGSYVETCGSLGIQSLYALIASAKSSEPLSPWLSLLQQGCKHLGVDVAYSSGSYSFINGGCLAAQPAIAEFLQQTLNEFGLFDSFDDAESYLALYQAEIDRGVNLETLDGAVPIELWEDLRLSQLMNLLQVAQRQ